MENSAVNNQSGALKLYMADDQSNGRLRVYGAPTGFPSPAEDYAQQKLDLHKLLIKNPPATYFARAEGETISDQDIGNGDLLIIDKSVTVRHGHVVVCVLNGELKVKRVQFLEDGRLELRGANADTMPIIVGGQDELHLDGVVIRVIKDVSRCSR